MTWPTTVPSDPAAEVASAELSAGEEVPARRVYGTFDLVVIGAGPGGSAAAITAAAAGLRVALVERSPFPRDRPGETLHPGVEPLLRQLGVAGRAHESGFERHCGHWVLGDGVSRFQPFGADKCGAWLGFQAWRAQLDAILLDEARRRGAIVLQPSHARQVALCCGRVAGVSTSWGLLEAPCVIDAGGGRHWLARKLSLPVVPHSAPLLVRYGYATSEGEGRPGDAPRHPILSLTESGWTWSAPIRRGLYAWSRLTLDNSSRCCAASRSRALEGAPTEGAPRGAWVGEARSRVRAGVGAPPELAGLRPLLPSRGEDVTWRAAAAAGPGYFLVGDAAAVLDPASGHGVLRALMSGIMAAHLAAQAERGACSRFQAADYYRAWLGHWFQSDLAQLREMYARFSTGFGASFDNHPAVPVGLASIQQPP